jgi:DNA-binding NarL/FixJ family response regulator
MRAMADPEREYRVMVVDDHPIWRDAVARDLAEEGFDVVATADGVASARRRAAVVTPDVVVMDMRLSDGTGAMATAEVLAVSPSSRILVLSASDERDDVLEAVKAGATGYLVKSASKVELAEAVHATAEVGPCSRQAWLVWCWGSTGGWHARPMPDPCHRASPNARPKSCAMSQRD